MSTNKKRISSTELSRKLNLRQKTCWLFHKKVAQAMKSSKLYPLKGIVEIDETVVGQQEEDVVGRANKKKKLVIVGIEKQGKGVSRMYVKVVPGASEKSFKPFFIDYIDKGRKLGQMDGQRIKLFWKIIPTSNRRKVARKVKISKICIG